MSVLRPFISAIFIIDELSHISHLPWKIAVESTLAFVDELIVVHGGHFNGEGGQPVFDYFKSHSDTRVRLFSFPWPDEFDWSQIGLSCAYGLAQAKGTWAFRVLADEIFPKCFLSIPNVLRELPTEIRQVSILRHYMLGGYYACPMLEKPLFFRNDGSMGYGRINVLQGPQSMPALFDDPIDTDHWFDGQNVISIQETSMVRATDCVNRLEKGELPIGFRDITGRNLKRLSIGMLNVDVNFFTDEEIIDQKTRSYAAYDRLPKGYLDRINPTGELILDALRKRVEGMLKGPIIRPVVPYELQKFYVASASISNCVRDICEKKYGLPWDQCSRNIFNVERIIKNICYLPLFETRGMLWKLQYRLSAR